MALAAGLTTGAMAFDHEAGSSGRHIGHFYTGTSGGMRDSQSRHVNRFAGVRGFESRRYYGSNDSYDGPSYRGGFVDLGPLGITTACGSYEHRPGYCGQGYAVDAWSR